MNMREATICNVFNSLLPDQTNLGTMQPNSIRPRRLLNPQLETSKSSTLNLDTKKSQDELALGHRERNCAAQTKNMVSVTHKAQEDASITAPSLLGTITDLNEHNNKPFEIHRDRPRPATDCKNNDTVSSLPIEYEHFPAVEGQKKVQFAVENSAKTQGADDQMATGTDNLLSYMGSLALTEMEFDASNQVDTLTALSQDVNQNFPSMEEEIKLRSECMSSSLLAKGCMGIQDQLKNFRNFLQGDLSHPMTQSSVVGSTCATTTLINSASAPIVNSTIYNSHVHKSGGSLMGVESSRDGDMISQPMIQREALQLSYHTSKNSSEALSEQAASAAQAPSSAAGPADNQLEVQESEPSKEQKNSMMKECDISKDHPLLDDISIKGQASAGDVANVQSQALLSKNPSSDVKLESSMSGKQEKAASGKATSARKRNYDSDLFFKVNGKLYQRLGKIGSGGSSEVHKVISSDCKIYALKKIKLKGRDYATAYGFSQEIEYLNKLKGQNHIIQLIDFEVTDKTLLHEVMNGSMSNKDGRVKEDGYIYMVLEYGEIDLAHMLSQKWKELDSSTSTIDENWLRFYWQVLNQLFPLLYFCLQFWVIDTNIYSSTRASKRLVIIGFSPLRAFGLF
ncbi:unnamed protein product [Ilex paraguariensis]|uniref:Protein kinase domain-containing protein n=1 Tax=Ilex paraguariensis TaxID=185542 RepID=A0ABC8TRH3_9AQUA